MLFLRRSWLEFFSGRARILYEGCRLSLSDDLVALWPRIPGMHKTGRDASLVEASVQRIAI